MVAPRVGSFRIHPRRRKRHSRECLAGSKRPVRADRAGLCAPRVAGVPAPVGKAKEPRRLGCAIHSSSIVKLGQGRDEMSAFAGAIHADSSAIEIDQSEGRGPSAFSSWARPAVRKHW